MLQEKVYTVKGERAEKCDLRMKAGGLKRIKLPLNKNQVLE